MVDTNQMNLNESDGISHLTLVQFYKMNAAIILILHKVEQRLINF